MVHALNDDELADCVITGFLKYREETDLRQFHAAKEFNSYIDELIKSSHRKAEQWFANKEL